MKRYDNILFNIDYSFYTYNDRACDAHKTDLITVWSPTFNNTASLDDYFDGINKQETKYPIEVLLIDDASSDEYFAKLQKSAADCRFHVKILRLCRNHHKKSEKHLLASRYVCGNYIAFCDPSDYWICRQKLDLQVDLDTQFATEIAARLGPYLHISDFGNGRSAC